MADVGTKRQREDQPTGATQATGQSSNLTPSDRTEGRYSQSQGQSQGLQRQGSQGMNRYQSGRQSPSVFSVTPGEFFTLNPISLMRRFTEDIDRAFGLSSGRGRGTSSTSDLDISPDDFTWTPTIEVRQQGDNLVIHADLPGLSENDVHVEATDDGLVIRGERRYEQTVNEGDVVRSERTYGRFYRLIPLPEDAKVENAKANFWNGVLEITVPVPESERRNRQIPIGSSPQVRQSGQTSHSGTSPSASASEGSSTSSSTGSSSERSRTATSSR
jgi:HSP20 family protein